MSENVIEVPLRFPASTYVTRPPVPAPAPVAAPPAPAAPAQAPAPAAPAPAPAAPAPSPAAAPEPAKEEVKPAPLTLDEPKAPVVPDPDETVQVIYNSTGDSGLDLALRFVGNLGFGPERPEMVAATQGDFTKLEATLKGLGDKAKGYEQYLTVAKDSYKRSTDARKAKDESDLQAVAKAVGGVERWNAVHAWAAANADEAQRRDINAALKQGGYAAVAMASHLSDLYKQTGEDKTPPKSVVAPNASAAPAVAGNAVNPETFKSEVRKLEAKYGYRLTETNEYKDLVARRRAYRS